MGPLPSPLRGSPGMTDCGSGPDPVTIVWADPDEGLRYRRLSDAIHRELGAETRTVRHEGRADLFVDMASQHREDLRTCELNHLLRDGLSSNREGRCLDVAGAHTPAHRTRS